MSSLRQAGGKPAKFNRYCDNPRKAKQQNKQIRRLQQRVNNYLHPYLLVRVFSDGKIKKDCPFVLFENALDICKIRNAAIANDPTTPYYWEVRANDLR